MSETFIRLWFIQTEARAVREDASLLGIKTGNHEN
jgi:hypothetical protein